MTKRDPITAIILAGGRSTRMQADKAQLLWRGRPFIEHIIERLQPQVDAIAINCNEQDLYRRFNIPLLPDPFAQRRGPLAGILAGLHFSATPLTLFVPCDNPLLAPDLVQRCHDALNNADLVYARSGGNNHYLYALMRSYLRDSAADYLQQGNFAVHRWYATQRCHAVDFDDSPEYFRNFNRPEDLLLLPQ
jgi:molybdopterin-guanine dinucleotide biosynthesis protein A